MKAYTAHMNSRTDETACSFNAQEQEYIRRELDQFFGTLPSVADGFQLRIWRGGPLAGQPKLPPALRTMVDSGLMEIRTDTPLPRAYFTERGLGALRRLASDRRYMDQHKFAHVRRELSLPNLEDVTASSHMKPI